MTVKLREGIMDEQEGSCIDSMQAKRDGLVQQSRELRNTILDMYHDRKINQYYTLYALVQSNIDGVEAEIETLKMWIENFNEEEAGRYDR